MTDVHDKKTRSYNMSQVKGKDTKPEILIRKFLFSKGFRYRLYDKKLPGKPDIVLPKYKTVIFINGCFWHGHEGCGYFVTPRTNTEWWLNKVNDTRERDKIKYKKLKESGWKILVVWECQLKTGKRNITLESLVKLICHE
jgi:DNA mismatch endonuclease, patch repair protein